MKNVNQGEELTFLSTNIGDQNKYTKHIILKWKNSTVYIVSLQVKNNF